MQKLTKILPILGIVVGILILGGVIGWFAGGSASKPRPAAPSPDDTAFHSANSAPPAQPAPGPNNTSGPSSAQPPSNSQSAPVPQAGQTVGIVTNWEESVDQILGAEIDDSNKVTQLFSLFPHVPADSQSELAQHLSNLVSDEGYAPLGQLLKDPTLSSDTLDVLMADVLNRPNSLKLPELLQVAETPEHPKADEAKDILSLFLDEDFGTDWAKWQEKMTQWLKDNPD